MRMITSAFKETLELGLQKPGQIVVRHSGSFISCCMQGSGYADQLEEMDARQISFDVMILNLLVF